MPVELALTPDSRWDIDVAGLVASAQQAGFTAVGLAVGRADEAAAQAYATAGLRCHELLALVVSDDHPATLSAAERLAEGAALVGAQWVLTVFRTGLSPESAALIKRCAAMFADAGAAMAVEFSPLGPVSSIPLGLDVVRAAGTGRAGLLIDTWHFSFGDSTWADLERVPLDQIAYVQFADAAQPLAGKPMEETMNGRLLPGGGDLELERFAATLLDRGWDGLVSVEVLNRDLRALPVPEFARLAYEAAARFWS